METLLSLLVILTGLILGSFFNVIIFRLPKNEFLSSARSKCPYCGATLRFYDNIPILSFIILRRKCRDCKAPISWQYPVVEGMTALLALLLFQMKAWPIGLPAQIVWQAGVSLILLFLIPVIVIDFRFRIIPNSITLGGLGLGLLLSLLPQGIRVTDALLGLLCGGGLLWLIGVTAERIYKKEAMGGGDIKLLAMAGTLLGLKLVLLAFILSTLIGSVIGLANKYWTKDSRFPFGPALAAGILIAWLAGDRILEWYFGFW